MEQQRTWRRTAPCAVLREAVDRVCDPDDNREGESMSIRLGEVLVRRGLLSEEQVATILTEQQRWHRPFGVLAEEMFGLGVGDVEQAWAEQYAAITQRIDVRQEEPDPRALAMVDRRQAWQFRVMPVRFDGEDLVVATTNEQLARALRFVSRVLATPCYLVLTESRMLGEALMHHFPMAGMTPESLLQPVPALVPNPRAA